MADRMQVDGERAASTSNGDGDDGSTIDESLYSRQLYVLGHDAMKRMAASNVLIVGLKGLGVEIAKDVCLAGVKSVTLFDPAPTELADLGTQFFLRESDIGQQRDKATLPRIRELNRYVPVNVLEEDALSDAVLSRFQVVVLTNATLQEQLRVNDYTHQNGIHFIAADVRGLFGSVFNDFGSQFPVIDTNGETPLNGMIVSVDEEGMVTTLDETRHGLEDGDYVTFSEIQGMQGLNDAEPRKISVKGPYTFSIGSVSGLGTYKQGGLFQQVKMPKLIDFKSLRESLTAPELFISDFAKFDRPATLHTGFQALSAFREKNGRLPAPGNDADAEQLIKLAGEINTAAKGEDEPDAKLLKQLAYQATGDLSPMVAVIGAFVAQEVLKACSGKFHPLYQFLYLDSLESLPTDAEKTLSEQECAPIGSRYDGQIAVFGKAFQAKIQQNRQFLVGAGAIGCEMLKNWAMMGLGTQGQGKIHVTDLDTIEKSNLNRQFLFRAKDLGSFKAEAAGSAVAEMNPDMKGRIEVHQTRVGEESENVFGDAFFENIDGVTNALDNVAARQYMDRRCVYYEKPLLESGTLGTKANTQVVLPHITESYSSSQDPPEKDFPMCTIKSFPNQIEHTIAWAKEQFEEAFVKTAENVNLYLGTANFLEAAKASGMSPSQLVQIRTNLENRPLSFEQCIEWARLKFQEEYGNSIKQLLFSLPKDMVTKEGTPFWSGPKRAPDAIEFDISNPLHLEYVVAAANIRAFNYGLKGSTDPAVFEKVLSSVIVPPFKPKTGLSVQVKDDEPVDTKDNEEQTLGDVAATLPSPSTLAGYRLIPAEFEKDDDTNHHIDFINAASNLRATNYQIQPTNKHKTKLIAGKIIPAIATTTSLATGLICLELYKIIDGKTDIEQYKNGFVNLALPFFGFSEPIAAAKLKYGETTWTLWDRFKLEQDYTLQEFIEHFKQQHKLEVTMVTSGSSLLYASFHPKAKLAERLPKPISSLVETISKKPIPPHVKYITLEIMAEDETEEDVEVPFVMLKVR